MCSFPLSLSLSLSLSHSLSVHDPGHSGLTATADAWGSAHPTVVSAHPPEPFGEKVIRIQEDGRQGHRKFGAEKIKSCVSERVCVCIHIKKKL
jgi:hypothetical protein